MVSPPDAPRPEQGDIEVARRDSALRILPSGRSITAHVGDAGEAIEIRSPDGQLEISIALTEDGPILRLEGAKLELVSPDSVSLQCRQFDLETSSNVNLRAHGSIDMRTDSELRTKSAGNTYLDGDFVNLNCLDRAGYHDDPATAGDPSGALDTQADTPANSLTNAAARAELEGPDEIDDQA
jgi:hypothetical protein